ncbi:DUF1449 family protein [Altererythrobacter aestuarii]|uniref:DUF1449 family protein n=2 Tax=Alteraurantiacibacter aestuarii TaxID=650004 RepID=A0A844ZQ62_9SPHN|nr:YqiJ family protein [Alteraurantiacibacter aestuarii]MXO87749.1 DUF1449 family protein [Alteraurantiacibacter aestuarii]
MSLLADHNLPFAIALGAMLLLSLLQIIGLGDLDSGSDVDVDLDADVSADLDAHASADGLPDVGVLGAVTTLLGIGRVPFLIWLIVFLFLFAGIGVSIQSLAQRLTGAPLYSWLAAVITLGATLPVTSALVRPLARILPRDETSAVALNTLVGRRAQITTGTARTGYPARASVRDQFGHTHHVMVEPHDANSELHEGDELLLVRREAQIFFGISVAERTLAPLS